MNENGPDIRVTNRRLRIGVFIQGGSLNPLSAIRYKHLPRTPYH